MRANNYLGDLNDTHYELTPQEQQHILGAKAHGVDVDALIRGLISGLPELDSTAEETISTYEDAARNVFSHRAPADLEAFLTQFAEIGSKTGYLVQNAFDRENLYEDRI